MFFTPILYRGIRHIGPSGVYCEILINFESRHFEWNFTYILLLYDVIYVTFSPNEILFSTSKK